MTRKRRGHRRLGSTPAAGIEAVARAFAKIIDGANTLDLAELQPE